MTDDLRDRLTDLVLRLEMGGTVAGEDAARTLREARGELDEATEGMAALPLLREEIEGLEAELAETEGR